MACSGSTLSSSSSSASSGAGALVEALLELARLRADPAQPAVQLARDDLALLVEQDVAEQRADEEGKAEQEDATCPGPYKTVTEAPNMMIRAQV